MGLVLANPALFINFLEALQLVSFNAFIQVDYPKPVQDILMMFSVFDGGDLPSLIAGNKYFMPGPKGFDVKGNDSLLLRNASQYIQLTFYFAVIYMVLKLVWVKKIKNLEN